MARIFHQLPDQKKAIGDVENLTMKQMDYISRRVLSIFRDDYPELSEAGNPAEELYKLAAKKAPYARWKASGQQEKGRVFPAKKEKKEKLKSKE